MSSQVDQAWEARLEQIAVDRQLLQYTIMETRYFWGPLTSETELEIEWDKVRLDACDEFARQVADIGGNALRDGDAEYPDTYDIAHSSMTEVMGDSPEYLDRGVADYSLRSGIVVECYGILNKMLGQIVGIDENGMILSPRHKKLSEI